MKYLTIGCLALFGSVFSASGVRAEQVSLLDREVTGIYVPRLPYWEAVQELVCQLEIPAGLSLGRLPDALFPGGLSDPEVVEMSQGYADLRLNPALARALVGPIEMRKTTVRAALDRFCRDSRVFRWKMDGGVVLIEPARSKLRPGVLFATVPVFKASEQGAADFFAEERPAADIFGNLVDTAKVPPDCVLWTGIAMQGSQGDGISLLPRVEPASWRVSGEMRDAALQDVLTRLVGGAPDRNGLWICYELPHSAGFSRKQPVSWIHLSTWSHVRRRFHTDELVRELVQLRKARPYDKGTRGYMRISIQREDYWLELARRAHFDPETVSKLLLEEAFTDSGEPRLGVLQLVALGLRPVMDALARHALNAEDKEVSESIVSEVPPRWAFEGAYREFWDKLAAGGLADLVDRDMRIQKDILAEYAKDKARSGIRVDLTRPGKDVWVSPFSAWDMHHHWPGWSGK